jgi:hypothetical protein
MTSPMTSKNTLSNARPNGRGEGANCAEAAGADADKPSAELSLSKELLGCFREYARERPEVVALWCLGVGFVLGWKLKPW